MQRYLLLKGIILKKQPSNENDWLLTIFCPELGKIQALSRSSRKILSQRGSRFDPLNLCTFQLYHKNDRYWVTECQTEETYPTIKADLEKSLLAFAVIELLLKTIQQEEDNQKLFQLTLSALDKLAREKNILFLEEFKIKFLNLAGSWPKLQHCDHCERQWLGTDSAIYSDHDGHLYCQTCHPLHPLATHQIHFNTIKLAHHLSREQALPPRLRVSGEELFHLRQFTSIFLGNYLHFELQSEKLLH